MERKKEWERGNKSVERDGKGMEKRKNESVKKELEKREDESVDKELEKGKTKVWKWQRWRKCWKSGVDLYSVA